MKCEEKIPDSLPIKTYCAQCIRLHRHLVAELLFQLMLKPFSSRTYSIRHFLLFPPSSSSCVCFFCFSVRKIVFIARAAAVTQTVEMCKRRSPGTEKIDTKKTTVGGVAIGCGAMRMDAVAIGCFCCVHKRIRAQRQRHKHKSIKHPASTANKAILVEFICSNSLAPSLSLSLALSFTRLLAWGPL